MKYIKHFEEIGVCDIALVGGKNSSLGEMISNLSSKGVNVPSGFAVTTLGYQTFVAHNNLGQKIDSLLSQLQSTNGHKVNLDEIGESLRSAILHATFPHDLQQEICQAYRGLQERYGELELDVAVRSSATAEDLPDASFAGQQDTFLNICGEQSLLDACRRVYASLFTNRAISYRIDKGYHKPVYLSIGIQKMVRSDKATSGVVFTLDTESGFRDVVFITASYGLGENVVQGNVVPDEYYVHKPTFLQGFKPILKKRLGSKSHKLVYRFLHASTSSTPIILSTVNETVPREEQQRFCLTDEQILELTRQALIIENHYSVIRGSYSPMDIEWAQDANNKIYIVQARPETIHSNKKREPVLEEYVINLTSNARPIVRGKSVGRKVVCGTARVCHTLAEMQKIQKGDILVSDQTDPDMEPYMRITAGIITQKGGRTCHAAIVSRELGIPCIVGADDAITRIEPGQMITMDCTNEVGLVYEGAVDHSIKRTPISSLPKLPVNIMMNVANPDEAFNVSQIPNEGVGLARLEFIINNTIRVHPMALVHPEQVLDPQDQKVINSLLATYPHYKEKKSQYFIDKLAQEAGTIAAAFYPRPVIFRMSDFKSNEYSQLVAGKYFEPTEENPMLGFRGASRYYHDCYKDAFALECRAMKKMREEMGLVNAKLMIPFVRTVEEARKVIFEMEKHGLVRGKNQLELYMMVEIPSNVILIDRFAALFDGFSIGSNDLTQMTLGVDRDSHLVMPLFDERNEAVLKMLKKAVKGAKRHHRKIGICGQAPSDFPEIAAFLMNIGIDSISLIPDTVVKTMFLLGEQL